MQLIIGGAYQGKLDYAKRKYALEEGDIFECTSEDILQYKRCIYHIERFSLYCVKNGVEPVDLLSQSEASWRDSIIICEDISSGVVPTDTLMRAWREINGRMLNWLSPRAEGVARLFCGLPQILK